MKIQLKQGVPRPADAIPSEFLKIYFEKVKKRGKFWYDLQYITLSLGLRNSEARLLKRSNIKISKEKISLYDEKQVKSWIKKKAYSFLNSDLQKKLQSYIHCEALKKNDEIRAVIADLSTDEEQLLKIAEKLNCVRKYKKIKSDYFRDNLQKQIDKFSKSKERPGGRLIDISNNKEVKKIINRRIKVARANKMQYLFNRSELNSNRAQEWGLNGDNAITRQTAYMFVKSIVDELSEQSSENKQLLDKVFISLHSLRKRTVQDIADKYDLFSASRWIGHGSGKGDIKTTQLYLNRSEFKDNEINKYCSSLNKEFIN